MLLFDSASELIEVQRGAVTCSRSLLITGGPGLELCLRLDFSRDGEQGGGSLGGRDPWKHWQRMGKKPVEDVLTRSSF